MSAPAVLRKVCAWCKAVTDGGGPVQPGEAVSHGICQTCREDFDQPHADDGGA